MTKVPQEKIYRYILAFIVTISFIIYYFVGVSGDKITLSI